MGATSQAETFLIVVATGVMLGLLFDFYRVLRGVFRPPFFVTLIADFVYWIVATAVVFGALLVGNWGEVRFYVYLALAGGVLLYYRWCSRYTMKLFIKLLRLMVLVIRTAKTVLIYILQPIAKLIKLLVLPLLFAKRKLAQWRQPPAENPPPD